jgi:hypothetical protein
MMKRPRMVGWYDPLQLLRTGFQVGASTLFGTRADYRLIEALAAPCDVGLDETKDENGPRDELWLDYTADVGDGWNPTYAVASLLALRKLNLRHPGDPKVHETERGKVLIFGGDAVYPTASKEAYTERTVRAYDTALDRTDAPNPHLYAIPGNHDWYDGLTSFTRLFCQQRWIGGWKTRQELSYFALKLPHRWWLCAVDVQLQSDIDLPQLEYFKRVGDVLEPDDRIIICTAEPHWVYGNVYDPRMGGNLSFLERELTKKSRARVALRLAGDLHHYRRHETEDRAEQNITCGGGGAFLHPTHGIVVEDLHIGRAGEEKVFKHRKSFPDPAVSRRLTWLNLLFPFINPLFGIVTGIMAAIFAWAMPHDRHASEATHSSLTALVRASLHEITEEPSIVLWMVVVLAGVILFTETHKAWYRLVAGTLHGVVQVAALMCAVWLADYASVALVGLHAHTPVQRLVAFLGAFAVGFVINPFILGIYLLISLNLFRRHSNEAFSSLRLQGWKSFLRLHITKDKLTIYPVGIRKVPRHWIEADNPSPSEPREIPAPDHPLRAELIEDPIEVK